MFAALRMNQPRKLIEREIRESELALLQAHTNKEHWDAQISMHTQKLKRLRTSWNAMQKEDEKVNSPSRDGKDNGN